MKRSEINQYLRTAEEAFARAGFHLPPFARLSAEEWKNLGDEYDEIRENMLGWDITDFGGGDFEKLGLLLLTMRNGAIGDPASKTYAEKLMYVLEDQVTPMHFHWKKMEDIINRGGGVLMMQLYNSTPEEALDKVGEVEVVSDGVKLRIPAGTVLELQPGQSVTLTHRMYHAFWAKPGHGPVLIGEVSQCNDDNTDNRFLEEMGRFPAIEEDEAPFRLLCTEYPAAKGCK